MRFAGILATICFLLGACQSKPPADDPAARVAAAEKLAQSAPTADSQINLSLVYYQTGNFQGCINSANQALKLRPEDALAYNNIAACQGALSHWDEEIDAAQHALRINPGFQLAQNNLAWAISERNKRR
jgi:tetratricopeptide (TPR) repeat protein